MVAQSLRTKANMLKWLVTVPFAGLVILTAALLYTIISNGGRYAETILIYYLPMFLYMWAIWMVRQALDRIAKGALFDEILPKLLFRVGLALFLGAVFTVFGQPLVNTLLYGNPLMRTFEPSPVTLGIIGAALALFAKLFERAAAMRAELNEFF